MWRLNQKLIRSLRPPSGHVKEMMVNENGVQERDQGCIGF